MPAGVGRHEDQSAFAAAVPSVGDVGCELDRVASSKVDLVATREEERPVTFDHVADRRVLGGVKSDQAAGLEIDEQDGHARLPAQDRKLGTAARILAGIESRPLMSLLLDA